MPALRLTHLLPCSLLFTAAVALAACGSDGEDNQNTGGSSGTAGTQSGGADGKGNSGGNAGASAGSGGAAGIASGGAAGAAGGSGDLGPSLAAAYATYFPIGVAVGQTHLAEQRELVLHHFNHLTAENAMKFSSTHPQETTWTTTEADALAAFARENGMKMTGHTFVWHLQTPAWVFQGLTPGDATSIETLKGRMKGHIEFLVNRYADVVDNWDVVNEAISDDPTKVWRDGAEGSKWYQYFGSEEYIYWAFKYAKDALEANQPGSSAGKLYYNDYNEPLKVDRMLDMVTWLAAKGVQIDGIGLQAHWRLDWPTTADLERTIDKIVDAGLKVKVSELDITVYNDYPPPDYGLEAAPEVAFTAELETQQANRYGAIFALLREKREHITSVSMWGTSDDRTWLDTFPVTRNNYPLLFDDNDQPKEAVTKIVEF